MQGSEKSKLSKVRKFATLAEAMESSWQVPEVLLAIPTNPYRSHRFLQHILTENETREASSLRGSQSPPACEYTRPGLYCLQRLQADGLSPV